MSFVNLASRVVVFAEKKAEDKRSKPEYVMLQDISTLPTGFSGANTASAIRLYGGFLFAGNRGDDSIAMYEIAEDGSLRLCSIEKTGGKTPRDFQIFSDFLVVANQDSDSLTGAAYQPGEKKDSKKTADPGGCQFVRRVSAAVGKSVVALFESDSDGVPAEK